MILVIGGRSKIGSALLDNLAARGYVVRALVRGEETSARFPDGVQPVRGDLDDPASLDAAMRGVEKVFLLCGPAAPEVRYNRNAIDAARRARVDLLVRSSILGADSGANAVFRRDHGQCDDYLVQSGLPHRILRPNLFLQNILENTIPSIDAEGNFYANAADARLSMVDTRDVADVAATLLGDPDRHPANVYDVTGPEAISYRDVAEALTTVLGRRINYIDVPDTAARDALIGAGLNEWMTQALVGLYRDYKTSATDGYAAQVSTTVHDVTGHAPRSLDDLLRTASGGALAQGTTP